MYQHVILIHLLYMMHTPQFNVEYQVRTSTFGHKSILQKRGKFITYILIIGTNIKLNEQQML